MPCSTRDKQRDYQRAWIKEKRRRRRKEFLKGKVCERCGFDDFRALEFHHCDPLQKDFSVGQMLSANIDVLHQEIEKCIVLCSNCHSIEHYNEGA